MRINHNILIPIINPADYANIKHKTPHIVEIRSNNKEIFLYGCNHSNNPKNPQFKIIKNTFNNFLKRHKNDKVVTVIEGTMPTTNISYNAIINLYRESGFMYKLSLSNKIKTINIEPSQEKILEFVVARKNNKLDIMIWVLLNTISTKIKNNKLLTDIDIIYIESLLLSLDRQLNTKILKTHSQSKNTANPILQKLVKRLKLFTNKKILADNLVGFKNHKLLKKEIRILENPFSSNTKINKVGSDLNLARDYFMSEAIISQFNQGMNIFGVLGINHVISQEPLFNKIIK